MKLLSPQSTFMRILSLAADLILMNVAALLLSLPIVTWGAAMAALYAVTGRMTRGEECSLKDLLKAFRQNLAQATAAWLIFGAAALALMAAFVLAGVLGGAVTTLISCAVYVMGGIWLITYSWAFPLLSQFSNKTGPTIINALKLSVAYLPRSIAMGLLNLFPWGLLYLNAGYFYSLTPLWLVAWFSGTAFLSSLLIKKPLAPYRLPEADDGGSGPC